MAGQPIAQGQDPSGNDLVWKRNRRESLSRINSAAFWRLPI